MAGKYTPLENYLRDLPADQKEVALSFEQIEAIINAKLPPSAYGFSSTCREKVQIWGCERAYARSHPQIWVSITEIPREPAYGYLQWWENEKEGNHVNARAWANAGWKVESVDFNRKQARLVRV